MIAGLEEFLEKSKIKYRKNEPGSKCTTLAVGGNLICLAEPQSAEEVSKLIQFFHDNNCRYYILGAGSNLIITDQEIELPVIRLGRGLRSYKEVPTKKTGYNSFEVGAAMSLMSLSRELSEQGLSGLEFAGGIPASFGGAVRMNAGAHGQEMSGILEEINYIDINGELVNAKRADIEFSYRHCSIPAEAVIVSAVISLKKDDPLLISKKRRDFLDYRKNTQPLTLPSFGSVFKNPSQDMAAGMLIEKAGLKGFAVGGAMISPMHANWIVNEERKATAEDVIKLMNIVIEKVKENSGVELQREVVILYSK